MASLLLTEMLLFNLPFSSLLPFFKKIIYLFLVTVGLHCCLGFSRVVESWGYSLVSVCGLLVAVACLVVEHRPEEHRLQELWHMGLVALQRVGSSQTRDRTCVSCIAGATEPPGKPLDFNFCFLPFIFSEMETESAC